MIKSREDFDRYIQHLKEEGITLHDVPDYAYSILGLNESIEMSPKEVELFKGYWYKMYKSNYLTFDGLLKLAPLIAIAIDRSERSSKLKEYA